MKFLLIFKIIIGSIIGLTVLFFLYYNPIKLDNFDKKVITFSRSPANVQKVYNIEFENRISGKWVGYTCISLDEAHKIKHDHTGMDDGLFILLFKGFNHHFYINEKHFTLQANKGHPFILFDTKLYYPKNLNLQKTNYKDEEYIEINLSTQLMN